MEFKNWVKTKQFRWYLPSSQTTSVSPVLQQANQCQQTGELAWEDVPLVIGDQ